MVDLADRRAETSSIRRDAHLEPAGLEDAQGGSTGRGDADAAPDHLTIAVLYYHPDAVRCCCLGAERCRGARTCCARSRADPHPEQGQDQDQRQQPSSRCPHGRPLRRVPSAMPATMRAAASAAIR